MDANQKQSVLRHLQDNGSITQIEATMEYGITRLAAVVFELRREGHNIESVTERGVNRYGRTVYYARYRLREA